ncbi:hypothetical protein [Mesorhizobium sp. B2-4-17]|uniref:hypothetical protein n=1 Tax=Mesorhizobium sp. B2-4-17 TaxID=2589932 RepID=UPI001129D45E|nr:hypothetical protein [Mesorhizobium sp. B2-4-17]TPK82592.1 hypothetical protein FJ548_19960 [Mesorhizobium sp. B2-4-17]
MQPVAGTSSTQIGLISPPVDIDRQFEERQASTHTTGIVLSDLHWTCLAHRTMAIHDGGLVGSGGRPAVLDIIIVSSAAIPPSPHATPPRHNHFRRTEITIT